MFRNEFEYDIWWTLGEIWRGLPKWFKLYTAGCVALLIFGVAGLVAPERDERHPEMVHNAHLLLSHVDHAGVGQERSDAGESHPSGHGP